MLPLNGSGRRVIQILNSKGEELKKKEKRKRKGKEQSQFSFLDTTPNRLLEGSPRHHFYQLDHHTLAGCRRHRSEDAEDKEVLAEEQ
ncbi:hypothetical protein MJO28_009984 [Puccinia striiformis f. sp. tritici]|uniref:Uncharacterized protein n=1 Tax=Puccinia striiformis f. sp. tritici TaxID=168172 RepID=A0ACC0E8M2_9BASI|nr:hypothetical protein MJO28_009984 [Puccinia striiformis f. sp. tritici]